jgi:hypothetical protein
MMTETTHTYLTTSYLYMAIESAIPNLKIGEGDKKLTDKILSEKADYSYAIIFGQDHHSITYALAECARCAQAEQ